MGAGSGRRTWMMLVEPERTRLATRKDQKLNDRAMPMAPTVSCVNPSTRMICMKGGMKAEGKRG